MTITDWSEKKLGDIAETTSGGTPDRKNQAFFDGPIPWVKSGELEDTFINDTEESITHEGLKRSSAKLFPAGTLLMAMYGATVGKTAVLKIEAATNQAVCAIFPQADQAETDFLRYALVYQRPEILKLRYGGAQPNISQQVIRNLIIRVPPLAEQRKIAGVLAVVQRAMEQQERLLALTAELKKALLHQLFTAGLRHEPQKETDIGPLPESWEVVPLTAVLAEELQNGAFARREQFGSGILFANVVDMYRKTHLDHSRLERVRFELPAIKQYLLGKGDVLIVRSSLKREGIGQNCVVGDLPEPAIYDCHLIRAVPDQAKIISEFLSSFWRSPVGKLDLIQRSKTVTMTTINQASISGALVPVSSLDEQRDIVALLAQIEAKEQVHRRKHATLTDLFRTLLHQLMTAQIRLRDLDLKHNGTQSYA